MPYCTIEEAWSQNLNQDMEHDEFKANELHDTKYSEIELPDSEVYDEDGKDIRCKKKKKHIKKRAPNMSRTYNRLSEHSGPKTRHVNDGNKRLIMKDSGTLDDSDNHANYSNSDMPINSYNSDLYEKLDDEEDISLDKAYQSKAIIDEDQSMMEDFKDMAYIDSNSKNVNILKSENRRLKKIIEELKLNKYEDKDSILDLVVYIFSGIMVILIMENITKLSRKI